MSPLSRRTAWPRALLLVALSAACGEPRAADGALDGRRAVQADGSAAAASGTLADGDEQVAFTRRDSADLVIVQETLTFGTDGRGTRRLVFTRDGALRAFDESRTQTLQSPDRTPAPSTVTLALVADWAGAMRGRKQVDGADAAVRDYDLSNARRHADVVRAALWRTPPGPPPDTRP